MQRINDAAARIELVKSIADNAGGAALADNSVTTAKIADDAINQAKLSSVLLGYLLSLDNATGNLSQARVDGLVAELATKLEASDLTPITTRLDDVESDLTDKQETLVSNVNIATINGQSLLSGNDITIAGGSGGVPDDGSVSEAKLTAPLRTKIESLAENSRFVAKNLADAQNYLDSASEGSILKLAPGTYVGGLVVNRDSITITSADPLMPAVIKGSKAVSGTWTNTSGNIWRIAHTDWQTRTGEPHLNNLFRNGRQMKMSRDVELDNMNTASVNGDRELFQLISTQAAAKLPNNFDHVEIASRVYGYQWWRGHITSVSGNIFTVEDRMYKRSRT